VNVDEFFGRYRLTATWWAVIGSAAYYWWLVGTVGR
jgi:hypothetical protein